MVDIGTTIATIKAIAGVVKDAGKIDLYSEVIDLQQTILELIDASAKAVEQNSRLTRELVAQREKVQRIPEFPSGDHREVPIIRVSLNVLHDRRCNGGCFRSGSFPSYDVDCGS